MFSKKLYNVFANIFYIKILPFVELPMVIIKKINF